VLVCVLKYMLCVDICFPEEVAGRLGDTCVLICSMCVDTCVDCLCTDPTTGRLPAAINCFHTPGPLLWPKSA